MKQAGTIHKVGETTQVSDKFRKREIIIKIDETSQYPQEIQFQVSQNKCELFDNIPEGTMVEVEFNLRGRKWTDLTGKEVWFNTLDIWRVKVGWFVDTYQNNQQTEQPAAQTESIEEKTATGGAPTPNTDKKAIDDDLPF